MNASLTDEQKILAWNDSLVRSAWTVDATKQGTLARDKSNMGAPSASLALETTIDLNCFFKVTGSFNVASVKAYFWTSEDFDAADVLTTDNASFEVDLTDVEKDSQGRYPYTCTGEPARRMFKPMYLCAVATDADGNTYSTGVVAFSAERYSYMNYNKADANTANLAKALALYGDAARAELGEE